MKRRKAWMRVEAGARNLAARKGCTVYTQDALDGPGLSGISMDAPDGMWFREESSHCFALDVKGWPEHEAWEEILRVLTESLVDCSSENPCPDFTSETEDDMGHCAFWDDYDDQPYWDGKIKDTLEALR